MIVKKSIYAALIGGSGFSTNSNSGGKQRKKHNKFETI